MGKPKEILCFKQLIYFPFIAKKLLGVLLESGSSHRGYFLELRLSSRLSILYLCMAIQSILNSFAIMLLCDVSAIACHLWRVFISFHIVSSNFGFVITSYLITNLRNSLTVFAFSIMNKTVVNKRPCQIIQKLRQSPQKR